MFQFHILYLTWLLQETSKFLSNKQELAEKHGHDFEEAHLIVEINSQLKSPKALLLALRSAGGFSPEVKVLQCIIRHVSTKPHISGKRTLSELEAGWSNLSPGDVMFQAHI